MSLCGMSLVNPQLRCISFRHMDGGDFFDWRCTISDINSPKTWCKKHKRSDGIWLLFFIFCKNITFCDFSAIASEFFFLDFCCATVGGMSLR